jgi:hypothetical protein
MADYFTVVEKLGVQAIGYFQLRHGQWALLAVSSWRKLWIKDKEIDGLTFMNMELMFTMTNPKKGNLKSI